MSTLEPLVHRSPLPVPQLRALPAAVREHARRDPAAPALIDGATGERWTRGELDARADALAAGLAARGIGSGDLVAVLMPNLAWWPAIALGVWRAGATLVPLSVLWTAADCARVLGRVRPTVAIAFGPFAPTLREALDSATPGAELYGLGASTAGRSLAELLAGGESPVREAEESPDRLAAMPFSSGTSGLPKGVRLSHRNLAASAAHAQDCLGFGDSPLDERAVALAGAPFFHSLGFGLMLAGPLAAGAAIVTAPRPELAGLLRLVESERVTHAAVPPPLVAALADDPLVDSHDLSSLSVVASGGAHIPAGLQLAASERLGCVVRQGYGITEATCVVAAPLRRPSTPRTCGWLMAGTEARLVDPETGRDADPGEPGELWVRGPQVMEGYHDDPDATAATLTEDRWLRTGDFVSFTADAELEILDRLKELIKVGGASVAPAEIELVLREHPGVSDAGVIGAPDPETGEAAIALVAVAEPGLAPEELAAFAAERLAAYKRPREILIVDDIPRLPTGKLVRGALRELAAASTR